MEAMREDGIDPPLPEQPLPHVTEWLMEAGPVMNTGMDRVPLSWQEITAWKRNVAVTLQPWEARLIRRLSIEYLGQLRLAEKIDCPPPWAVEMTEDAREVVDRKLDAMFAMFG